MHRALAILLGLLMPCGAALSTGACAPPSAEAKATRVRVVGLGSAVTETLFALGVGEAVVGADLSSLHPPATATLPKVGYFRQFSAEGVLSLAPDLVLASSDTGPAVALDRLRGAGVKVQVLGPSASLDDARSNLRAIAAAVERVAEGEALIAAIDRQVEEVAALRARTGVRPRVLFVYARGPGSVMVAGSETPAAEMLRLAGATNAIDAFTGFRPISAEAVIAAHPDFIVIPARGLESIGGVAGLGSQPGVAQTTAADRVIAIDDLKLLGFGPRVGEALLELVRGLHPELDAD